MNILEHFGVGVDALAELNTIKSPKTSGRVLLYDGDGACYDPQIIGVAKLETAVRRFESNILEQMYRANCSSARVHLTPEGCHKNGRKLLKTVKPYQEQRANKAKPLLLEQLRSRAPELFKDHPDIKVFSHYDVEADDALMMDSYLFGNACLISADKDLTISPFEQYDVDEGVFLILPEGDNFGYIKRKEWLTPSGTPKSKVVGKGTKFFWAQMIMGDPADNVKGLIHLDRKPCGPATALVHIGCIDNEDECANYVINQYRAIDQNVVAEAEAMWLLRHRQDSGLNYLLERDLTPKNKAFVESCVERGYKHEVHEDE